MKKAPAPETQGPFFFSSGNFVMLIENPMSFPHRRESSDAPMH
jgi:hypothetical protein